MDRKHSFLLTGLASTLLLAAGLAFWFTSRQNTAPGSQGGDPVPSVRQIRSSPLSNGSPAPAAAEPTADAAAHPADVKEVPRETILAEIEGAAVTYDAAALPRIERFLLHPDPQVRVSARDGMIILGDAAASPLLREASRHASDPKEAAALLEAADYLELPSATPKLRKRSSDPKP